MQYDCVVRQRIWEFLRREDRSYAISRDGEVLSDNVPEDRLEAEFCVRFGFCGQEYEHIVRELENYGKCRIVLQYPSKP